MAFSAIHNLFHVFILIFYKKTILLIKYMIKYYWHQGVGLSHSLKQYLEVVMIDKVLNLIKEPLKKEGIDIVSISYEKETSNYFLRIIIDKIGGVDLDCCVLASNIINPILDEADIIDDDNYILDVCSKGGN